jgi:glutathione synthase/RimK-type ligase-like ATP-grasp enzyme
MLCDDKSALSEKLINSKIECVPHYFLMLPTDVIHLSSNDKNLMKITKMLKKQRVIVIKPNNGTGGEHVYKISNNDELITRAKIIFTHYSSLAYSPYYSISHEYRVVIINQKSVLVYEKIRATSE